LISEKGATKMSIETNVKTLEAFGLTLVDIDDIAKREILLFSKIEEINQIEDELSRMKDDVYLIVERLFEMSPKGSDDAKLLSNAEKRAIEVKDRLREDKKYRELATSCGKMRSEAKILEIAVNSLKRKHERYIKGL
jgi:hypothetical protein